MGRIFHASVVEFSAVDLSWLQGRRVLDVSWADPLPWIFSFDDGSCLTVECPWRIVRDFKVVISSEDHLQQYGLPAPIDAAAQAREYLSKGEVADVSLREGTLDLLFQLRSGVSLEIVPFSCGYEAWQLTSPGRRQIVGGGAGQISTYDE